MQHPTLSIVTGHAWLIFSFLLGYAINVLAVANNPRQRAGQLLMMKEMACMVLIDLH